MSDQVDNAHNPTPATAPLALRLSEGLGPNVQRESVDDALLIVESYGPWGADLNDAHRRQIVLADEVKMLREALRKLLNMDPAYMRGPKVEEAVEAAWVALGPNAEVSGLSDGPPC